ncbi:MAG TPA: ADP-glyceromanno-heptose 6-epimerase [Acidimicrobiales bacterium]|nr:ADP-glyceromanno-heptose 6-epimerase [Acidimicrobiales bacterium]
MTSLLMVTGAAGFIGRNVVAEVNRRGSSDIVLVDSLGTNEKWRNLVGLRFEDVVPPEGIWDWLRGRGRGSLSGIVHLGACSSTTEADAEYLMRNNYRYTRGLCEWALANSTRFVYASSAATYGDGSGGFSDEDAVTERLAPLNMYGYSKHVFDLWALRNKLFDRIVGLKYFNVFGPYEDHKGDMRSVVAKAYEEIRRTGKLSLFKSCREGIVDGEQRRDFIFVEDAVDVTLHFLAEGTASGLLNCGTGIARTWLDLGTAVFSSLGIAPAIEFVDMPVPLRDKYQYFTQADTRKLRAAGYAKKFHTLEDGVDKYVRAYLTARRP